MQLIYINALTRIYSYTDSKPAVAKQLNQDGHGNRGGDKCTQKRPRNGCGYPKSKKGKWLERLDLNHYDKEVIEEGGFLSDRHMYATHKLLKKQFPDLNGLQSTLLNQTAGFTPVSANGKTYHLFIKLHTCLSYKCMTV